MSGKVSFKKIDDSSDKKSELVTQTSVHKMVRSSNQTLPAAIVVTQTAGKAQLQLAAEIIGTVKKSFDKQSGKPVGVRLTRAVNEANTIVYNHLLSDPSAQGAKFSLLLCTAEEHDLHIARSGEGQVFVALSADDRGPRPIFATPESSAYLGSNFLVTPDIKKFERLNQVSSGFLAISQKAKPAITIHKNTALSLIDVGTVVAPLQQSAREFNLSKILPTLLGLLLLSIIGFGGWLFASNLGEQANAAATQTAEAEQLAVVATQNAAATQTAEAEQLAVVATQNAAATQTAEAEQLAVVATQNAAATQTAEAEQLAAVATQNAAAAQTAEAEQLAAVATQNAAAAQIAEAEQLAVVATQNAAATQTAEAEQLAVVATQNAAATQTAVAVAQTAEAGRAVEAEQATVAVAPTAEAARVAVAVGQNVAGTQAAVLEPALNVTLSSTLLITQVLELVRDSSFEPQPHVYLENGQINFQWNTSYQLPQGFGYEVFFWEGDMNPQVNPSVGFGLSPPKQDTRLTINLDKLYKESSGGWLREQDYRWGVRLAQKDPYLAIRFLGEGGLVSFRPLSNQNNLDD